MRRKSCLRFFYGKIFVLMPRLLISQFVHLKTIQFQERLFSLPLPRIPGSLLCPVAALVNHLRINQVPKDMPLFSVRSGSSLSHITYTHFSSFLAKVIKAVGLDSTSYSPHSFRRGGATFAFELKYHLS